MLENGENVLLIYYYFFSNVDKPLKHDRFVDIFLFYSYFYLPMDSYLKCPLSESQVLIFCLDYWFYPA